MPRVHELQPSFNAGELTPRLHNRIDFNKYRSGAETVENLICLPEGGLIKRSGSRYVSEIKDSSVKGRLFPFQFSTTQNYMLELGDQVMRFYRNQGTISVADTDASVTNGTFDSDISSWDATNSTGGGTVTHNSTLNAMDLDPGGATGTDLAWAEQDITTTATGTEHVLKFQVISRSGEQVRIQIGTSSGGSETFGPTDRNGGYHAIPFTPAASPFYIQFIADGSVANQVITIDNVSLIDNAVVEIQTPWAEADLFEIEGPQSADTLYFFHGDYPTHKLIRRGHTHWELRQVQWEDGPYLDENTSTTTLTPSAASGIAVNLTLSSTDGVNDNQGWLSTDVGRLVRYKKEGGTPLVGYAKITSITSTTIAVAEVKSAFASAPDAQTTFSLGAWSGTTGYPRNGTFFEERLYAAGTDDQPQTFWASQTSDFENFTPDNRDGTNDETVEADDALTFTLSSDKVNAIRWLSAGEDALVIGTTGGEWVPEASGAVITPLDITVRRQTTHGSARIQPVRAGQSVLFVQSAKRKIREFSLDQLAIKYKAIDLTRLAEHITFGGIMEMDYAEEPNSLIWAVRDDGQLLSMTYRREEDVVGWSRHILGGTFSTGNAVVDSVSVIPGSNGAGQVQDSTSRDEVWIIVKRTINGATKRYIEFLERDFETGHDQEDAYYVDSCITYDGAAATALTGLDHLEGETVQIWADGYIAEEKTVSGGGITLDIAASVAQIGLAPQYKLETLKVISGNPAGTKIGKTGRIYGITFAVLNSHILKYGPDTSNLKTIDFRKVSDAMDTAVPLFTGEEFEEFQGPWTTDSRIVLQSTDPAPFNLMALAPEIDVNPLK